MLSQPAPLTSIVSFKPSPWVRFEEQTTAGVLSPVFVLSMGLLDQDGFSEVALLVAASDAFVYCGPHLTAPVPYFAPQLNEEHSISRVLADKGHAPFAGDLGVPKRPVAPLHLHHLPPSSDFSTSECRYESL